MSGRARLLTSALATLCCAGAALGVPAVTDVAIASPGAASQRIVTGPFTADLPHDGPPALYAAQPRLPDPRHWPASNTGFPATSGTGRLTDGAFYWTDFLYDDHGATTASAGDPSVTAGSPSFGTYRYASSAARNNGADIFRAAVALRPHATYWRVDWNTLADPRVPIAEWTFDRDNNPATGGSAWPASAGVRSPGIDTALVVSRAGGARLVNAVTGAVMHRCRYWISREARSFVVRVPNRWLAPNGTWRVRLAAGVASPDGRRFAQPPGTAPDQPAVYNVTFRSRAQEPVKNDFWDDEAQTQALDSGDVSRFSALVDWSALRDRVRTPAPMPTGWSDRWYVSSVSLGQGVITSPESIADGEPNYLGRVQPYAIYVPHGYTGRRPVPLTWLLHSLTQNHNQYAATTPNFVQQACQQRMSICVSPLGRGPDGNYYGTAELDFWQVWHALAAAYNLYPARTVLAGYSMGGIGTNQLAMEHPDLFARAITLAGGVGQVPELVNLRWVPVYLAGGAEDELVPVTVQRAEADALAQRGYRFRWIVVPAMDHVAYELADSFADAARYMRGAGRVTDPGEFTFRWPPAGGAQTFGQRGTGGGGISWTEMPRLGVKTTGDYWLRHLRARDRSRDARVRAYSGMRPAPAITPHLTSAVDPAMQPEPSYVTEQTWKTGATPAPRRRIALQLVNVASLRVLAGAAGFRRGGGRLTVTTDGPVTIAIGGRQLRFPPGTHRVRF